MPRSNYKKAEEEIITLYKNIIILICVAMKAIDQIVGLKAQRVKVPRTISSGYNLTLIVSQASSPQYFNTNKLFSSSGDSSLSGLYDRQHFDIWASLTHIFLNKKMERLGMLISKPATFTSSGKHQLLTPHAARGEEI